MNLTQQDNLVYARTHILDTRAPTLIRLDYTQVDRVAFIAYPESQFVIDNLSVSAGAHSDSDSDSDGVPDALDQCPDTAPGAVVNRHGCSIDQLVPCAGPPSGGQWKDHAHYVSAVARVAQSFRRAGLITAAEMAAIVRAAAESDCGKKPHHRHPPHPF